MRRPGQKRVRRQLQRKELPSLPSQPRQVGAQAVRLQPRELLARQWKRPNPHHTPASCLEADFYERKSRQRHLLNQRTNFSQKCQTEDQFQLQRKERSLRRTKRKTEGVFNHLD